MIRMNSALFANVIGIANAPLSLTDATILAWSSGGSINADVINHITSYLMAPPMNSGPYEIHPYIVRESLHFDLTRKTLLLGTIPPNSYLNNITPIAILAAGNPAVMAAPALDFYYGNTVALWNFFGLPGIPTKGAVTAFLLNNDVSISDVIIGTQRRVFSSPKDKYL